MSFANFIRGIVRKNPNLKLKLKQANSKQSPFQYIYQTLTMSAMTLIAFIVIVYMFLKSNLMYLLLGELATLLTLPIIYKFWLSVVDVQTMRLGRELDRDILFVSEYFLVSIESGLPLANSIENFSRINRPGGKFFKRIYTEFKTGKSFDEALEEGARFSPSKDMKTLIKRLQDSLNIGVDLKKVLENFIEDASEKKLIEARSFSKKLNPIVMMYLLLGIVLPSLGVTVLILVAAISNLTEALLRLMLILLFLLMFAFQYYAYSMFKFNKSTL